MWRLSCIELDGPLVGFHELIRASELNRQSYTSRRATRDSFRVTRHILWSPFSQCDRALSQKPSFHHRQRRLLYDQRGLLGLPFRLRVLRQQLVDGRHREILLWVHRYSMGEGTKVPQFHSDCVRYLQSHSWFMLHYHLSAGVSIEASCLPTSNLYHWLDVW